MNRRLVTGALRLLTTGGSLNDIGGIAGKGGADLLAVGRSYSTTVTPEEFTPIRPPVNFGVRYKCLILIENEVCCVRVVPEKKAFVVERFGRFLRVLDSGLHFLIPVVRQKLNWM